MCAYQAIELQETSTDSGGPQARLNLATSQSQTFSQYRLDISSSNLQISEASSIIQPEIFSYTRLDISSSNLQISECRKYNRCGKSTCIHCSTIYQSKKTKEVVKNIKAKELIRIVLTLKSTPETALNELIMKLFDSFRRLRRTAFWKQNIKGGFARLHVDFNISWNPHFDIIAEPLTAESDFTEAKLSKLWLQITKDSHNLKIQTVTKTELSHTKLSTYVLKPTFQGIKDNEQLMHVYSKAVKGKKKFQKFGTWVNTQFRKDWIK